MPKKPIPPNLEVVKTPWLVVAEGELGVTEIRGRQHNPRVLEYGTAVTYHVKTDEVSWCANFVCWCLEQCGIPSTRSARARSFEHWGVEIAQPIYGCVVVFWRGSKSSGKGHVALWVGETKKYILVLGGNQSNTVKISRYPKSQLLSYRMPA